MPMRASVLAAVLLAAGLVPAGADSQHELPMPLLEAVLSAPSHVSYSAVVETVRTGGHGSQASVYRIEHRAPDLTRRNYSAPPDLLGSSDIVKGNRTFRIDPKHRRIVETATATLGDFQEKTSAALIRANYRALRVGTEMFDGRPTIDALLVNRHTHRATTFVRVDSQTKIVLDKQEFGADGALVSETRLAQVRYGEVPAANFALPKEYAVVAAQQSIGPAEDPDRLIREAGFAARKPSLPEGFAPLDGDVVTLRGTRTVQLLYSDGIRTVSLFESPAAVMPNLNPLHPESVSIGSRNAEYAEDGSVALLTWNDGTLYYTLVGDLGRPELRSIAGTITP
jgi:negative regulator of sigma E activity